MMVSPYYKPEVVIRSDSNKQVQCLVVNEMHQSVKIDPSVKNVSQFQGGRAFSGDIQGLIPAPSSVQKTAYHVLNGLGQWIDIRTLVA